MKEYGLRSQPKSLTLYLYVAWTAMANEHTNKSLDKIS